MQAQANKKNNNNFFKRLVGTAEFTTAVPLFALIAIMALIALTLRPDAWNWFGWANLSSILTMFPYIGLVSLAASFPLTVGHVDISTGRLVGFSVMVTAVGILDWGLNPLLVAVIAILLTSLFGILNGFLVVKLNVPDFVATMGTLYISGGCRYLLFEGIELTMIEYEPVQKVLAFFDDTNRFLQLPMNFWIVLAIFVAVAFIMKKTLFGRRLLAVGDNREVAALAGINPTNYRMYAYYICAFLCGVCGVIYCLSAKVGRPSTGDGWEFRAIAACVVGGTSLAGGKTSPIGVFIGCFLVMAVENAILFFSDVVPSTMQVAVRGVIMAAAVLWDMARQKKKIKA